MDINAVYELLNSAFSCIYVYVGVVVSTGNELLDDYILIITGAQHTNLMYTLKQHNLLMAIAKGVTYRGTIL